MTTLLIVELLSEDKFLIYFDHHWLIAVVDTREAAESAAHDFGDKYMATFGKTIRTEWDKHGPRNSEEL